VPGGTLLVEQSKKYAGLTAREQTVARFAADGLSNKAIARELGLRVGTVKAHMHSIFQKLRIKTRMTLIPTAGRATQRGSSHKRAAGASNAKAEYLDVAVDGFGPA